MTVVVVHVYRTDVGVLFPEVELYEWVTGDRGSQRKKLVVWGNEGPKFTSPTKYRKKFVPSDFDP
jgi:hypothetical protein